MPPSLFIGSFFTKCVALRYYQDVSLYNRLLLALFKGNDDNLCIHSHKLRWIYWIVGFTFGSVSKLMGSKTILKMGIWVEARAVAHYDKLLSSVDWDTDTRRVIEKNQADEYGHINRWQKLMKNYD